MDYEASIYDVLERLLHDESAEARELPLSLLRAITNDFADSRIIVRGAFSVVYKGVLPNGTVVAVEKLSHLFDTDDKRMGNEIRCLMSMRHKNIVRLLGYCGDTQLKAVQYEGQFVVADVRERLLCFEYPGGRTLDAYITDASEGLNWRKRYKIIKGICEGLYCVHQNLIVHLDLQSATIWLDEKKEPKIHGFGCSRRLEEKKSNVRAEDIVGSIGSMAPEYLSNGVITLKADIYRLGVLIAEILAGRQKYPVVENILENWVYRFGTSLEDKRLEQIRVCAEIAKMCFNDDPEKRPDVEHIIETLVETESIDEFTELDETESVDEFVESDAQPESVQIMELNILERVVAGSEEPSRLDYLLLQKITENFSKHKKIGVGGCGEVYKGTLQNGDVAVKRLFKIWTTKDKMFHREVKSLITARHQNIVRFLGYCSVTEEEAIPYKGGTIMVDIRERLLCFEYIGNGNLENHLTDELRGLEWHTRYEIIVGICRGLLYLHNEKNIIHMDLKPANILLDDLMVPKITDFGLSRLRNNSQAPTTTRLISPGYCAPEYFQEGKSSSKSDIYSLGIMVLELVTGSKKDPSLTKVLRRWRHRWIKSSKHRPLNYKQIRKCLELAQRCIQINPKARPDMVYIMQELDTIDSEGDRFQEIPCLDDMLGISPLEIHFPFELDSQISHSIELTNDTDGYIAFMMTAILRSFRIEPDKGIVPPRSKCSVTIKMQAQVKEYELLNNQYKEKITVQSTMVDGGLAATDITGDVFIEKGTVVDEVNVMVVFDNPPSAEES